MMVLRIHIIPPPHHPKHQKHQKQAEALQRQARRQPYPEARAQQRRAEKHLRDATVCGDEALTIAQELYGADSAQVCVGGWGGWGGCTLCVCGVY